MDSTISSSIDSLVTGLLESYHPSWGMGTMAVSVYDTAWIACVSKTVSGATQWLFPPSFLYILETQDINGAWPAHAEHPQIDSSEDCILSTMAALFCLEQHLRDPHQLSRWYSSEDIRYRITLGLAALSELLASWHIADCKAVGFEILAPALLDLLEKERGPLYFPDRATLMSIRDKKLSKIKPEMLYGKTPLTLLHSLEAFYGKPDFDFDRVAHHKVGGSMLASPSSTAAYIMRSSVWDDEAEAYLRLTISNSYGRSSGAVPSAYPSTYFEITWVISTLLEADLWPFDKEDANSQKILEILESTRLENGGLVGFAPGIPPDMDDSSKGSIIYSLLGREGYSKDIIARFETANCLKTYDFERDPSLSANCNGLLAILFDKSEYDGKDRVVEKIVRFICSSWFTANGILGDKWNLSHYYPAMLMAEALCKTFEEWDRGNLPTLPESILRDEVLLVGLQCLVQTLQSQKLNGSWGTIGPVEETSYAILTLAALRSLPWATYFQPQLSAAIGRARSFLDGTKSHTEYLWIEKVTYRSPYLVSAYVTAAQNVSIRSLKFGARSKDLCRIPSLSDFTASIDKHISHKEPRWIIIASWIEAELYLRRLEQLSDDKTHLVFSSKDTATIFKWTMANNISSIKLAPSLMVSILPASILIDRVILHISNFDVLGKYSNSIALTTILDASSRRFDHSSSISEASDVSPNSDDTSIESCDGIPSESPTKITETNEHGLNITESLTETNDLHHNNDFIEKDAREQEPGIHERDTALIDRWSQAETQKEKFSNSPISDDELEVNKAIREAISELSDFFIHHPQLKAADALVKDTIELELTKFFASQEFKSLCMVKAGIPASSGFSRRLYEHSWSTPDQAGISLLLAFSVCLGCHDQISNLVQFFHNDTRMD